MIDNDEVTVVSYNVHSCVGSDGVYSVERIAQTLVSQNPTIVGLQEVEVNQSFQRTRIWSTSHESDQPKEIAESLNFDHVCFAPSVQSVATSSYHETHDYDIVGSGNFGIAILSKYPILQHIEHRYKQYRKKSPRNALACLIQLNDSTKIWVVNTHLGCHTGEEQFQQSLELSTFIETLDKKSQNDDDIAGIILMGDFNSHPHFKSIKVMKDSAKMIDAWETKGTGSTGATFPAVTLPMLPFCSCIPPLLRLDYIFMRDSSSTIIRNNRKKINVGYCHVVKNETAIASDHLALCAILVIVQT